MTGTDDRIIQSGLLPECRKDFDHLEALDRLDALLAGGVHVVAAQLFLHAMQVQIAQQLAHRFGAHARTERVAVLIAVFAVLLFGEDLALEQRRSARDR